jgi:hypothetical protein
MTKKCKNPISRLHSNDSLWLAAFDWTTNLVAATLDHALALLAAAMAGLLAGHRIGRIYASQVEPLYVRDLRELAGWQVIPHTFATSGAVVGAVAGLLLIVILHRKSLTEKVISRIKASVLSPPQMTETIEATDEQIPQVGAGPSRSGRVIQEKGQRR